jgi:hypothetical protein
MSNSIKPVTRPLTRQLTRQERYKLRHNRKSLATNIDANVKEEIDYIRNTLNISLPDIIKAGILVYMDVIRKREL